MESQRTLRCYDYVNHPYARVRDVLLANPHYVFRHATAAASTEAAALHVKLLGLDIGTEVAIRVLGVDHEQAYNNPATRISLEWHATTNPRMFPTMHASLVIFPLSSTETQLELVGEYDPPLGKLGELVDSALGHRLAEASVVTFVREVAGWLREELATVPVEQPEPAEQAPADQEC